MYAAGSRPSIYLIYSTLRKQPTFRDPATGFPREIRTLCNDDNDGSENVAKKKNLSNLIASIWTRSICQMQSTFPGVEFLTILFKLKKRKESSSSYVHVLHKTSN